MKKLFLFLPLLITPFLGACEGEAESTFLTFGTLKDSEAIHLTSSEFSTHVENNENFLLAIYPRDSTCSCWRNFSSVINEAVKEDHLLIYKYCAEDVSDNQVMKEIGGFNDRLDAPTFYIIKEKQIAKYYNYSSKTDFFKTRDGFISELEKHIKTPKMLYINEEQLDKAIGDQDDFNVFYARNKCSDCNYVIPNSLLPYYMKEGNEAKDLLYIFDLQIYRDTDKDLYQEKKDKYLLSEKTNPELGFSTGVVPTFQHFEKGEMTDMCIYVNEGELTYSETDECYYALGAYYQGERLELFHYLDNVEVKDLSKVQIKEEDTSTYENSHYWNINSSSLYYDKILEGFLDKYL